MVEQYLTKTGRLSCKQPQELKNQWYIQKFQEVHGDTYDYSNVVYTNSYTNVEIICREHGCFTQRPSAHLEGKSCPKCGGKIRKTTETCIQDFVLAHGDKYDYSKVEYSTNKDKVIIICKQHGSFLQRPNDHLAGKGCPKCKGHSQNTLYILRCLNTGLIKIGITNNIKRRMRDIGGSLQCLYHTTLENHRSLEKQLHKKYKDYNTFNHTVNNGGTEFFQLTTEQLESLIQEIKCLEN